MRLLKKLVITAPMNYNENKTLFWCIPASTILCSFLETAK